MIAAEMISDSRKRAISQLAAQIHGDLPAIRDMLRALFRLQIGQLDMEEIRDGLLNHLHDSNLRISS